MAAAAPRHAVRLGPGSDHACNRQQQAVTANSNRQQQAEAAARSLRGGRWVQVGIDGFEERSRARDTEVEMVTRAEPEVKVEVELKVEAWMEAEVKAGAEVEGKTEKEVGEGAEMEREVGAVMEVDDLQEEAEATRWSRDEGGGGERGREMDSEVERGAEMNSKGSWAIRGSP